MYKKCNTQKECVNLLKWIAAQCKADKGQNEYELKLSTGKKEAQNECGLGHDQDHIKVMALDRVSQS